MLLVCLLVELRLAAGGTEDAVAKQHGTLKFFSS